jgi:release factor glutamine methyltransferase
MILKEILDKTTQFFKDKKIETPRLDAELLLSSALGFTRIELYLKFEKTLNDTELTKCRDFVRRRSTGEPVAYILGKKDFYGLTFDVAPGVLVPRPETELLVDEIVRHFKDRKEESLKILDLGCGTGCISLALLSQLPNAKATLLDISEKAVEISKANAEKLNFSDRVEIRMQDAGRCFDATKYFDVIVANPPYIADGDPLVQTSVREFEPGEALFAGPNGTEKISEWFSAYNQQLEKCGIIGFEVGHTQTGYLADLMKSRSDYRAVKIVKDLSGLERHVVAVRGH